ncbi:hypothetical protein ASG47_09110 [Devosia sp. Leaf420]|uniref:hypothetical protein n=1 Tax=Devosia sp. Leaf420 TaxID=1736374 RepID=UPI00071239A5|nr:hypothetical protein [Devosia sp. Leaf420]KQT48494.1 hypothetical protein ASG47_09110 [Devosia sp. Leaf420]
MPVASFNQTISHALAMRHEALWLRFHALHKDICAIAAKKPDALVGESERIVAEGLIHDMRPFLSKPIKPLPAAALHFAGLAVQLGQFMARLEDFENRHAHWDGKRFCRVWRITGEGVGVPVGRLRQEVKPYELQTHDGKNMRELLAKRLEQRNRHIFEMGFKAGLAARIGPPPSPANPDA